MGSISDSLSPLSLPHHSGELHSTPLGAIGDDTDPDFASGVRLVLPLPEMVADALADLSPREAVVAFACLGVWLRTHPGRQPLRSSVDMLPPLG